MAGCFVGCPNTIPRLGALEILSPANDGFLKRTSQILGNILAHAAAETHGVVRAQYRPKQQRVDTVICNAGRGSLGSLQPTFPEVRSYGQAIDKAIQRGGTYQIWTGVVVYELNKGKRRPGFQGMNPTVQAMANVVVAQRLGQQISS